MSDESDRWRRVDALCQEALQRPEAERRGFLVDACDDPDERAEVEALLAHAAAAEHFLDLPLGAAAVSVLPAAMTSLSGTSVGAFTVGSLLGAGGMGEVYRARDTRLNREVALKILPLTFALNPDRLDRFRREAQALASLNHVNIGAIYGFEEADGLYALVLELVEGPTLADRLEQGPIPLAEAIPMARQMAEALESAHEHGIVHNDFKPSNVKRRPDGAVKVLDFGLATVMRATIGDASDATPAAPHSGAPIFGTPGYASPEQLKGLGDKRSDVWAFGAVLYEMLSGQRAFPQKDEPTSPDWTALPSSTPEPLRRLIRRCLDRDVRSRLRDIGEARIALEEQAAFDVPAEESADPVHDRQARKARRFSWRATATVVGSAAAGALVMAGLLLRQPAAEAVRLSFTLPEGQSLSTGDRSIAAISPDGKQIVYVAAPAGLYLRSLSASGSTPILGTDDNTNVGEPVFSPDGQSVLFHSSGDQTLKRVRVSGGAALTLCRALFPYGVSWTDEGIVFVEPGRGIVRVDPSGGQPQVIVALAPNRAAQSPQLLPGGERLLYTLAAGTAPDRWDRARVVVRSLASGEEATLLEGGSDARYVATGHLVYAVSGNLFAVPFDLRRMRLTGAAVPLVRGLRRGAPATTGTAQYSIAGTRALMYVPGTSSANWALGLTDRRGSIERLPLPAGLYEAPRVSSDGKRIVFGTDDGKEAIVWVYDLAGHTAPRRLTFGGNARFPTWSRDGARVAFQFDRDGDAGIFWQPLDGGPAERLTNPGAGEAHEPEAWSPTSDTLIFSSMKGDDITLWTLSLKTRAAARFSNVHSSSRTGAAVSPDGRWLAYASSDASGKTIYVEPVPATGTKYQLAVPGDRQPNHPLWSPDGTELFYNPGPGRFEAIPVVTAPAFAFGNPVAVPRFFPGASTRIRRPFDVLPNGLFVSPVTPGGAGHSSGSVQEIRVVLDWFSELSAEAVDTKGSR